jgi:hypothetical protein
MWKLTIGYNILKHELNNPNLNHIKKIHLNICMQVFSEHKNYEIKELVQSA